MTLNKNPNQRPSSKELMENSAVKLWVYQFTEKLSSKDRVSASIIKQHINKVIPFYFEEKKEKIIAQLSSKNSRYKESKCI